MSGPVDPAVLAAASALATYLVHSTCALATAWLGVTLARPAARARELAWKAALVLPLVTTAVHGAWPGGALAPRFAVPVPAASAASGSPSAAAQRTAPERRPGRAAAPSAAEGVAAPAQGAPRAGGRRAALRAWLAVVASLAATCVLLVPRLRLARLLRRRAPLAAGVLAEELAGLAARPGAPARLRRVRLSVCDALDSPIALGVLRPEIVVPPRAVSGLARPLARALVAHELAHHARRDPFWSALAHAIAALCPLQPLHRVARRELVSCAELLADDLALEWTHDGLGLARCLAEVGGWVARPLPAGAAVGMVRPAEARGLRRRVERALSERGETARRGAVWPPALAAACAAAAAPGLAFVLERGPARPALARTEGAAHAALDLLAQELADVASDLAPLARAPDAAHRAAALALAGRAAGLRAQVERLRPLAEHDRPSVADGGGRADIPGGTEHR